MVTPSLHAIIGYGRVSVCTVGSSYPAIAGRFWLERASVTERLKGSSLVYIVSHGKTTCVHPTGLTSAALVIGNCSNYKIARISLPHLRYSLPQLAIAYTSYTGGANLIMGMWV